MPGGRNLSSEDLAALIVDALSDAELVDREDLDRAIAIATEEINARKAVGDYSAPPLVPMRRRMGLFLISLFGGFVILWSVLPEPWHIVGPLLWALAHMVAQAALFRCPHCAKLAVWTPSGWTTLFVGHHCRWCHRPY